MHTSIIAAAPQIRWAPSPRSARIALVAASVLGGGSAWLVARRLDASVAADPDLARLMQLMALIKLAMTAGALWLIDWRLRVTSSLAAAAFYAATGALLTAGPVLIWHPATVLSGAIVFHAGLGLLLLVGWRDRGTMSGLLAGMVRDRAARQVSRPGQFARRGSRSI